MDLVTSGGGVDEVALSYGILSEIVAILLGVVVAGAVWFVRLEDFVFFCLNN